MKCLGQRPPRPRPPRPGPPRPRPTGPWRPTRPTNLPPVTTPATGETLTYNDALYKSCASSVNKWFTCTVHLYWHALALEFEQTLVFFALYDCTFSILLIHLYLYYARQQNLACKNAIHFDSIQVYQFSKNWDIPNLNKMSAGHSWHESGRA